VTIRKKLIFAFLLILFEFCVGAYFSTSVFENMLVKFIGQESALLAHEALDKVDRVIHSRIEEGRVLSKGMLLQEAVKESNLEFEKMGDAQAMEAVIDLRDKDWIATSEDELSPFMQDILSQPLSKQLSERIAFYQKQYGYNLIGEIFITNRYGANVAQTGKTSDYRQDDEAWWQAAKAEGVYISDVKYDESAHVQAIEICVRIDGVNEEFLGVIKIVLNVRQIADIFKELEDEKEIIGQSTQNITEFELITADYKYIYATEKHHQIGSKVEEAIIQNVPASVKAGRNYWFKEDDSSRQDRNLYAFARSNGFRDYKGLGWILVIEQKADEILAPVKKAQNIIILLLLIAGAFVILTGVIVYRMVTIPLMKLTQAAIKIGDGNLGIRIESESKDEIGTMARVFNDMVDKLKKSYTGLEEKVQERTAELQASQEYSRSIIETATDAFVGIDNKGVVIDWNHQAVMIFGWTRFEAIGRPLADTIIPVQYREAHKKGMERFLETGEGPVLNRRVELTALHRDGHEFPIELTIWAIQSNGDYRFNAFIHDITNRKASEKALQESEKRFKAIYEGSNDAVMLLTPEGFFDCNKRTLEMFGFETKEEFCRTHPSDVSPPFQANGLNSFSEAQQRIQTAFEKGFHQFEWLHRRKNGEVFSAEVLLSAFDFEGRHVLQATVRDISERKKTENQLRHLYQAVEQSPNSIVITDTAGNIEYVNSKFIQVTGYSKEELIGRSPRILKSGQTPPQEYEKLWKTISSGEEWRGTLCNRKKSGELYWESVAISPMKSERGEITHYLGIKEDITDQKKMADDLQVNFEDLKQFQQATIDRENKMIELKKEINELSRQTGRPLPYDLSFLEPE